MLDTKEICIIVDGYSTGKFLAPEFNKKGYACLHIRSSIELSEKYKTKSDDFIETLVFDEQSDPELKNLLNRLEKYSGKIKLCIPGYESGVELADKLSEKLFLPTNSCKKINIRRNKYAMIEAVKEADLQVAEHCQSEQLEDILQWAKKLKEATIVLKPLDSANGDNVHFCQYQQNIKNAFQAIINSKNLFGQNNKFVLAETYSEGEEHIVNTVSWNSKHFITEIWKIKRVPYSTIYLYAEIMQKEDPAFIPIKEYTFKTLNALGIRYGAGTTELKYSIEKGATLLETSARLMGDAPLIISENVFGHTQLSLLVEAYIEPEKFLKRCENNDNYAPKMKCRVAVMRSEQAGKLNAEPDLSQLKELPTYYGHSFALTKGDKLEKTINSLTAAGEVYFVHENEKKLEEDYLKFRKIEQEFYKNMLSSSNIKIVEFN